MIRSYDGMSPTIADSAHIDETAVVIGDVVIQPQASIWPNATLRGDDGRIVVGTGSNVQDNAVLHEDAVLGTDTTVGHNAIVHAATVGDGVIVGMNSVILDDAHVGDGSIIGAGAVVTEGTEVPPETLMVGIPAEPKTELEDPGTWESAAEYRALATTHQNTSERLD
ncbi:gamma carbonic anhydrase family protein [Halopenitus sp. H-Gu1]|uniref:gamma carbonic anhydrase family protein n=1 Tax=Halopenitus sp. H-Gu1 TaxID=3242697 RepID=UPI00359EEF24